MFSTKSIIFSLFCFTCQIVYSQQFNINGIVKTNLNSEGIHVINKTGKFYTTTNKKGEFDITARLNDTIFFSSLTHKDTSIVVTSSLVKNKRVIVKLTEQIYVLDEVFIPKMLSGNLLNDMNRIKIDQSIDLGIPIRIPKKMTTSERELHYVGVFKPIMLLDLILEGEMEFDPVINGISGKTKKLKKMAQLEHKMLIMTNIRNNLSANFFSHHKLEQRERPIFLLFCEQSSDLLERCKGKNNLEILKFLEEKLILYKEKIKTEKID